MPKRAKYVGPDEETRVYDPEDTYLRDPIAVVKQGAYLPSDLPQKLHLELGERDHWQLEEAPSTDKKKGDE